MDLLLVAPSICQARDLLSDVLCHAWVCMCMRGKRSRLC